MLSVHSHGQTRSARRPCHVVISLLRDKDKGAVCFVKDRCPGNTSLSTFIWSGNCFPLLPCIKTDKKIKYWTFYFDLGFRFYFIFCSGGMTVFLSRKPHPQGLEAKWCVAAPQ